MSNIAI